MTDFGHYSNDLVTIESPSGIKVGDPAAILSMTKQVKADLPGDRIGINVGRDNERK